MDTIAVCVCTFQREALLEACLSSVAAMALALRKRLIDEQL